MGQLYRVGRGVRRDRGKALYWLTRSLEAGNESARVAVGKVYLSYPSNAFSDWMGVRHLRRAADSGDLAAMRMLSGLYRDGRRVEEADEGAATNRCAPPLTGQNLPPTPQSPS